MGAARRWFRRARLGLPTVLGLPPGGFFIPYRYAAWLPAPGKRPAYAAVEELFVARRHAFAEVLAGLATFAAEFQAIARAAAEVRDSPPVPRWDQGWFPTLDAAVAYAMVRRRRPRRIVEVGSGHSTRFLARAVSDGALDTDIVAIDPAPRAAIAALPVRLRRETLATAGHALFDVPTSGDLLFIDSSHILMPGTDVDLLFNEVMPRLPTGALVHMHDIFLPDDYPAEWSWRGYNEQLAVVSMLLGKQWEVLFASHYAATRMPAEVAASPVHDLPSHPSAIPASLWLQRG